MWALSGVLLVSGDCGLVLSLRPLSFDQEPAPVDHTYKFDVKVYTVLSEPSFIPRLLIDNMYLFNVV